MSGFFASESRDSHRCAPNLAYARARTIEQSNKFLRKFPGGRLLIFPGGHILFILEVIERVAPRYVKVATLLYVGDTGAKHARFDRETIAMLGVEVDDHRKLPDVILHDGDNGWVILDRALDEALK
jgi:adenine-specific DNA-methyltransferase